MVDNYLKKLNTINSNINIIENILNEKFDIRFDDGATSYGKIINNVAYISNIQAPKLNDKTIEPKRGTKTYERVLNELYNKGVREVVIQMQSSDSRVAIKKMIDRDVLKNPTNYTGLIIDEHPTKFDISDNIKMKL